MDLERRLLIETLANEIKSDFPQDDNGIDWKNLSAELEIVYLEDKRFCVPITSFRDNKHYVGISPQDINSKEGPFIQAHEFGHALLCHSDITHSKEEGEAEANYFASLITGEPKPTFDISILDAVKFRFFPNEGERAFKKGVDEYHRLCDRIFADYEIQERKAEEERNAAEQKEKYLALKDVDKEHLPESLNFKTSKKPRMSSELKSKIDLGDVLDNYADVEFAWMLLREGKTDEFNLYREQTGGKVIDFSRHLKTRKFAETSFYLDKDVVNGTDLTGIDLSYVILGHADFRGVNLSSANLSHSVFRDCDFRSFAGFNRTSFYQTDVEKTLFEKCDMRDTDISKTVNEGCYFASDMRDIEQASLVGSWNPDGLVAKASLDKVDGETYINAEVLGRRISMDVFMKECGFEADRDLSDYSVIIINGKYMGTETKNIVNNDPNTLLVLGYENNIDLSQILGNKVKAIEGGSASLTKEGQENTVTTMDYVERLRGEGARELPPVDTKIHPYDMGVLEEENIGGESIVIDFEHGLSDDDQNFYHGSHEGIQYDSSSTSRVKTAQRQKMKIVVAPESDIAVIESIDDTARVDEDEFIEHRDSSFDSNYVDRDKNYLFETHGKVYSKGPVVLGSSHNMSDVISSANVIIMNNSFPRGILGAEKTILSPSATFHQCEVAHGEVIDYTSRTLKYDRKPNQKMIG